MVTAVAWVAAVLIPGPGTSTCGRQGQINKYIIFKKTKNSSPVVVQQKQIRLGTMRLRVLSLALLSG